MKGEGGQYLLLFRVNLKLFLAAGLGIFIGWFNIFNKLSGIKFKV